MKANELAKELLKHPDFEVEFSFRDKKSNSKWPNYRKFEKIQIDDIGYSGRVICLGGEEDE